MKTSSPILALLIFWLAAPYENSLSAQTAAAGSIAGAVVDGDDQPAEFATVTLYLQSDSSLVKGDFTDENGAFLFESIPYDAYFLKITLIGAEDFYVPNIQLIHTSPVIDLGKLRMEESVQQLAEVIVTAQKPFIERHADKLVMNVENSAVAAGQNALELLRRAPGVVVDNNDLISLRGRQGVLVMIDGKQTYLSLVEVANLLKNMPSESIQSIEIITQPSAKYDAAGNAGIINIRLKKDKNLGFNGNLTAGTGAGLVWFDQLYEKANGNLNLNYRTKKVNVFGSYGYRHGQNRNDLNLDRRVNFEDTLTYFDSHSSMDRRFGSHNFKAGADYSLNARHTLGLQVNGFAADEQIYMLNRSDIFVNDLRSGALEVGNERPGGWSNYTYNLNYRAVFDSLGRELTADADYSQYRGNSFDNILTTFISAEGVPTFTEQLRSEVPIQVNIRAFKADYTHPLRSGLKFETGLKASLVSTDNNVRFDLFENGEWRVDSSKTNHFQYEENIAAAYLNAARQYEKWGFQAGLRAEYTQSVGNSITLSKVVDRDYLEFFPSLALQYRRSDKHQFALNYSRRIDRPSYQDLNPFIYFLDPYSYVQGNPFLNPMFTHSVEASHTFKGAVNASLSYSRTEDFMTQVTIQNDTTKTTVATQYNLDNFHNYGFTLSSPIPIAKWWTAQANLNLNYRSFQAEFLGARLDNRGFTANVYMSNRITLPKGLTAELSGWYQAPQADGIFTGRSMYMADFGLSKTFLEKRATIRLNVSDVFNTGRWRGYTLYENMDLQVNSKWESRRVFVNFSYRFGNQNVKGPQRRNTGSEEERNRVKMDRG